jgi:UDP-N-acetylmuramate dehydrogenase
MVILENVGLARYTTLGIGGPARWFVEAADEDEIVEAVRWARLRGLPIFVLGGGSNLVVSDEGFDGLVLRVVLKGIEAADLGEERVLRVAAGEDWDGFVSRAVAQNSAGVECLAGIPGTVGGTPVQNVGAYGQEVSETIERVRVLELETLEFRERSPAECGFGYRSSVFNTTDRGRFLVTRVDFRLRPGGAPSLRYADLRKAFPEGSQPGLVEVAEEVRRIRRGKGMLLVEGDADCRSAGSFFKNPVLEVEKFATISSRTGLDIQHYPADLGRVKVPAAWLIEQAGFRKGYEVGQVGISSKHTLALVNLGGATARDLMALRDLIVDGVRERFGIELEMEPVVLGDRD